MTAPLYTQVEKAQRAISKRVEQMMRHLSMGDESTAKKNFRDMKKHESELEFARFKAEAEAELAAEQVRLQALSRLRGQRESSQAKIVEARRYVELIEKEIAALGQHYSSLLTLAASAYNEAPDAEKPKVGYAKFKDGTLTNAMLVALQKAGLPVLKEVDALRGQATLSDAFEIGVRQLMPKETNDDD